MTRNGEIEFDWADGVYTFRLGIKQLAKLQEARDTGPAWLFQRIEADLWRAEDLIETIRWGLIGGGKTPDQARELVRAWVEERPLAESIVPALMILAAAVAGPEDEPLKKTAESETTTDQTSNSQTESSDLPSSMATALE